ncbi:MAG: MFS transporter [Symbiobacteriia bacterium]
MAEAKAQSRPALAWWQVLYRYSVFESGDSAWSLIIVSTYFGAFLQAALGQSGAHFGWAIMTASLVIALASPVLGALADHSGRRQPYLRVFVLAAVLFTALLAFAGAVWQAMLFFILAYISVNGAFTFFTAMLPAVSNERNVSTIIAMTVGIGYAGGLVSMLTLGRLVPSDEFAGRVFLPMAAIYLVFALPAMFLSPDFRPLGGKPLDVGAAYRRIGTTIREVRKHRFLFRFLVGDFLYENAVASVITLMGLYSRNVMGFKASELTAVFGPAIVIAMLSAWVVFGPLIRLIGPKRTVLVDLGVWLLLFILTLAIRPGTHLDLGPLHLGTKALFTVAVAPLAGMGLAGVWSASRVLLTALTPVEKAGEFWGLYNLSGRTASVLGDATWALILTLLGERLFGYQVAIVALALFVVGGGILILTLPDARPTAANFVAAAREEVA